VIRCAGLLLVAVAGLGAAEGALGGVVLDLPEGWTRDLALSERAATWRSPSDVGAPGEEATVEEREAHAAAEARRAAVTIAWQDLDGDAPGPAATVERAREGILDLGTAAEILAEDEPAPGWRRLRYRLVMGRDPWIQECWLHVDAAAGRVRCVTFSTGAGYWERWTETFDAMRPRLANAGGTE